MISLRCRLGCPVWAHSPWIGRFFTAEARVPDFLPQYASVFGTAEGNTTFYGLPAAATVRRWAEEAPAHFRFCFKFPREISHERQLVGAEEEVHRFFERLEPLAGRLGPFFLQLHASFGADRLPALGAFLAGLPRAHAYAVEVRHADFFDGGLREAALDRLLAEHGTDRVIFDTRGLFASTATDAATLDAKRRKPRVPVRFTATGPRPFVRFVGDPVVENNDARLEAWAAVVARWLEEGREPYFFTHHPDDVHAPRLGRRFQAMLHARTALVPAPPPWPCERAAAEKEPQLELF